MVENNDILKNAKSYKDCLHEVKPNEEFVGNTNVRGGLEIPEHLRILKTARLGNQAYDIHGVLINRNYMRPLIIGKEDLHLYDIIQMKRLSESSR